MEENSGKPEATNRLAMGIIAGLLVAFVVFWWLFYIDATFAKNATSLIDAVAWPAVFVTLALLFRHQFGELLKATISLINRMRRFGWRDVKAEFDPVRIAKRVGDPDRAAWVEHQLREIGYPGIRLLAAMSVSTQGLRLTLYTTHVKSYGPALQTLLRCEHAKKLDDGTYQITRSGLELVRFTQDDTASQLGIENAGIQS